MRTTIEISDDDDSIEADTNKNHGYFKSNFEPQGSAANKSREDQGNAANNLSADADVTLLSSDEETLPEVSVKTAKSNIIKKLFPVFPKNKYQSKIPPTVPSDKPKDKGVVKMIGGVEVCLPVVPYGSQVALMAKVIEAMKKGKNCLLESPTGSGKTLALLCGALACQASEKDRIALTEAQNLVSLHPDLESINGVTEYCASPMKENMSPEKLFQKNQFGSKSIYDEPKASTSNGDTPACKRQEPLSPPLGGDSSTAGLVQIHKKPRLDVTEDESWKESFMQGEDFLELTPEKKEIENGPKETPEKIRALYNKIENIQLRTSMLVHCRAPKIYYGARTHKQLEQVIKEFGRTYYTDIAKMTILSSREYSCIREFDRKLWGNKNEMCRGCTKAIKEKNSTFDRNKSETNCKHFDNRSALNRKTLPPCFDLEDLISIGHEVVACPFYAARALQADADIVFCPYNYLIDPGIRDNLQIHLEDSIVVIDEAHNIEDICREAATFTLTKDHIETAIHELDVVKNYRFQNSDAMCFVEVIYKALRNMADWFHNQMPLINNQPVVGNEAVYKWQVTDFVNTLNNHNIGQQQYKEFQNSAEVFTRKMRMEPRSLLGVSQATSSLIENISAALGYLFRDDGKHMDDFKPALVKTVCMDGESSGHWRQSQFNKSVSKESLHLRLLCLNPGVVFATLKCARSIILASGTLTPMLSFHSELDTKFELKISPSHIIPKDRVWVGTLSKGPRGNDLMCTSSNTDQVLTQDSIGDAILHVCRVTPHGVLCFLPSYALMNKLINRWRQSGLWKKLNDTKNVYQESRDVKDHNKIMETYYDRVSSDKGCLLFAVYRGKVSEGMDFKDHQARAVITVGVPFPNSYDMPVAEKKLYNDKYCQKRNLLNGDEWLQVQAYRALNQAVGRCVRHCRDWGAVLMIDSRFKSEQYTRHLSQWVRNFLQSNHHTYESLVNSYDSLESFMQRMTLKEAEDI